MRSPSRLFDRRDAIITDDTYIHSAERINVTGEVLSSAPCHREEGNPPSVASIHSFHFAHQCLRGVVH